MEPKNIAALILSMIILLILLVCGVAIDRHFLRRRELLFGSFNINKTMFKRYGNVSWPLLIVSGYILIAVLMMFYFAFDGGFYERSFVFIYLSSAVVAYCLLFVEYKRIVYRYRTALAYVSSIGVTLVLVYSDTVVDQHLQKITSLPAEFFPTSQTVLVFFISPVFFSLVFYLLSLVLYVFIAVGLVFPMQVDSKTKLSRFFHVISLFVMFMFLTVGAFKIHREIFTLEYDNSYSEAFIEYSYNRNERTCSNLDEGLYISHLRTGGVSVAYKKADGDYYFSVDKCDREAGNYPKIYMK